LKIPKLRPEELAEVSALTANQQLMIDAWRNDANIIANGSAGTGKTFLAIALALATVLDPKSEQNRVIIVRSAVPTRAIGFLAGDADEKVEIYQAPYVGILNELAAKGGWQRAIASGQIVFESTSYLRGTTMDRAVVVVDEMQNMSFHECDSIITRLGESCRTIWCGDYRQTDFIFQDEAEGLKKFLRILETLSSFETITFTWADIVRSRLVREYICAKEKLASEGTNPLPYLRPSSRFANPSLNTET
jgi:phosphate starvation-inducible PhoH-like protein